MQAMPGPVQTNSCFSPLPATLGSQEGLGSELEKWEKIDGGGARGLQVREAGRSRQVSLVM